MWRAWENKVGFLKKKDACDCGADEFKACVTYICVYIYTMIIESLFSSSLIGNREDFVVV